MHSPIYGMTEGPVQLNITKSFIEALAPIVKVGLSEYEGTRHFEEKIRSRKNILRKLIQMGWATPSIAFLVKLHDMEAPQCPECGTTMNVDCPAAVCPNRKCGEAIYIDIPESEAMCKSCISYKMRKCALGLEKGKKKGGDNDERKEQ